MVVAQKLRRLVLAAVTGLSLAATVGGASIVTGALAPAQAQVSGEFRDALEPYGEWRQHPRWGEVWVPDQRPPGWQPYTVGHWVYTDDWGWFWVSEDDEADWGWVTYHYGRWIHDRETGWFWVPGDEWAPAWVNWRRGDSFVGWAPLPPDDVVYEYDDNPDAWVFVEPRYMAAPRLRGFYLPPQRSAFVLRSTVLVNRSFSANRAGARIAVNPGISPGFIGAASRSGVPTYRVRPRVLASTQGVSGGVAVRPQDLRTRGAPGPNPAPAISVQKTTTLIQPAVSVPKAEPLRKDERGRLGTHPPRAAQGDAPGGPAPQLQQQQVAPPPPQGPPPAPGPRPGQAPLAVPQASPRPEPPRQEPREERRDQRPPGGNAPAMRPSEPPPQAKPERPITPQTPPPPPPAQMAPRQAAPPPPPSVIHLPAAPPPPVARPPAPPPPPAARPPAPAPPPPPAARPAPPKSDEKKPEVPK
jgi:hypothetical protein